ncbi:MAG: LamG-like jellyroll fold domain-containing protein [Candidatus Micrarchaeia archaeon]
MEKASDTHRQDSESRNSLNPKIRIRHAGKVFSKAQSAMEYLMTYGWAILIIAVVLGALFQLGVFNANNFAPKAPPGSCQVFRPNGPGTTSFINLEGICSGELPQYVAQFNGQSSYIIIPHSSSYAVTGAFSISWWFSSALPLTASFDGEMLTSRQPTDTTFDMQLIGGGAYGGSGWSGLHGDIGTGTGTWLSTSVDYEFPFSQNTWYNVVVVFTTTGWSIFLNGKNVSSGTYNGIPSLLDSNSYLKIGTPAPFFGSIANVQIYNTSLSSNDIEALYQEGIGGAPIDLQNLVGWWPLNGDANDYSGNGNNGVPTNVTFTSNWWSGYTPP